MEIIIRGEPKEIAALVVAIQERQTVKTFSFPNIDAEKITKEILSELETEYPKIKQTISNKVFCRESADLRRLLDGVAETANQPQETNGERNGGQGDTISDETYFSMKRVADLNRAFDILVEASKNRIDEFPPDLSSAYSALNPALEQVIQEEAKYLASL